jgi:hypothetical protein
MVKELHPRSPSGLTRFSGPGHYCSANHPKVVLPAGLAPASVRLEDECLVCWATAASEIGQRGRTCTCDLSVPSRGCWLLHYALEIPVHPATHRDFSGGGRISATLLAEAAGGIGGPEGICTLNRPADNGALF